MFGAEKRERMTRNTMGPHNPSARGQYGAAPGHPRLPLDQIRSVKARQGPRTHDCFPKQGTEAEAGARVGGAEEGSE